VQTNQNCLLLYQLTRPHLHHNLLCWFHCYHLHRLMSFHGSQNIIQPPTSTSTKIFSTMQKFEISSKGLDGATRYKSTNSPSLKTSSLTVNSSFSSWTTLTWPLEFGFHYESLMNSWTMLSKGRIVCVINLLTLFGKNKNIIDIAEFSL